MPKWFTKWLTKRKRLQHECALMEKPSESESGFTLPVVGSHETNPFSNKRRKQFGGRDAKMDE